MLSKLTRFRVKKLDEYGNRSKHILEVNTSKRILLWRTADGELLAETTASQIEIDNIQSIKAFVGARALQTKSRATRGYRKIIIFLSDQSNFGILFESMREREEFVGMMMILNDFITIDMINKESLAAVSKCKSCDRPFSLVTLRHECGNCHGSFCYNCSQMRAKSSNSSDEFLRVCTECFKNLKAAQVDVRVKNLNFSQEEEMGDTISYATQSTGRLEEMKSPEISTSESVDVYGFFKLPTVSEDVHEKWINERQTVWENYLLKNPTLEPTNELKNNVRAGIPPKLRGNIWKVLAGADKYRNMYPKDYYEKLVLLGDNQKENEVNQLQIERDLKRTFPSHAFFDRKGITPLRRILTAYSIRNPVVGYCQSMNFIVATLMLFMEEEDAFWMLCLIVERITSTLSLGKGQYMGQEGLQPAFIYYQKDLGGLMVDQRVFEDLVQAKLPKVASKFEEFDVEIGPLTMKWFLCLFVNTVPLQLTLRIWDSMFLEGAKVIHRAALALLKSMEGIIIESASFEIFHQKMKAFINCLSEQDQEQLFLHRAFDSLWIGLFSSKRLLSLRQKCSEQVTSLLGIQPQSLRHTIAQQHMTLFNEVLPDLKFKSIKVPRNRMSIISSSKFAFRNSPMTQEEVEDLLQKLHLSHIDTPDEFKDNGDAQSEQQ